MRRRRFVGLVGTAALATSCGARVDAPIGARPVEPPQPDPPAPKPAPSPSPFVHGVASGDPLADRVVLWTRVELTADRDEDIEWMIAEDPALAQVVASGVAPCSAARDHTVKVDAGGLAPGRTYHYGFRLGVHHSPVGRTRTLPVGPTERVRLAAVSCANYPTGFFGVYGAIARRDDLDLVLHLGDYIYEYADGEYGDPLALGRLLSPPTECFSLADYRARHGLYKRDPQLQALHARHPVVAIWDDHELANDAWMDGAKNHEAVEGPWAPRRDAAVQAYREWMPIRDPPQPGSLQIHRAFRLGDLLELAVLDTRLVGRDKQLEAGDQRGLAHRSRSLLGAAQERWLLDRLQRAHDEGVTWRVIGQQVIFGQLRGADGNPLELDKWDGYPAARDRILEFVARRGITDLIVLTGDIHSSFAFELGRDPFARRPSPALAVELVAPAVSSPPLTRMPPAEQLLAAHPHLRWAEVTQRGYVTLELSPTEARATWHLVADVGVPEIEVPAVKAFVIPRGRAQLLDAPPA
jgi:alkaline phosphatase D